VEDFHEGGEGQNSCLDDVSASTSKKAPKKLSRNRKRKAMELLTPTSDKPVMLSAALTMILNSNQKIKQAKLNEESAIKPHDWIDDLDWLSIPSIAEQPTEVSAAKDKLPVDSFQSYEKSDELGREDSLANYDFTVSVGTQELVQYLDDKSIDLM
jgi:hypothetical protein